MANITRRGSTQNQSEGLSYWDPFRMMRDFLRMDPFGSFLAPSEAAFAPSIEVKETKDAFVLRADIPGVKREELDIALSGNRLTISGKREAEREEQDERYVAYERMYGSFSRSFVLPESADLERISAELEDGVLNLRVPKKAEVQPRRIQVAGGQQVGGVMGQQAGGAEKHVSVREGAANEAGESKATKAA